MDALVTTFVGHCGRHQGSKWQQGRLLVEQDGEGPVSSDHNRYPQQGAVMDLVNLTRDFIVSSLANGIGRSIEEVKIERVSSQAEESVVS